MHHCFTDINFNKLEKKKFKHIIFHPLNNICNDVNIITQKFNVKDYVFVKQEHTNIVHTITKNNLHDIYNKKVADAIVTNVENLIINIYTADCVALFLVDSTNKIIAIAHAGYKGAKLGIIECTIQEMLRIGAKIHNISAMLSPSIQQLSYEIKEDFYNEFIEINSNNANFFIRSEGKIFFSLQSYVIDKLQYMNVNNIINSNIDTYTNKGFASYRRFTKGIDTERTYNLNSMMLYPFGYKDLSDLCVKKNYNRHYFNHIDLDGVYGDKHSQFNIEQNVYKLQNKKTFCTDYTHNDDTTLQPTHMPYNILRKIKKNNIKINATLDLHGFFLLDAKIAFIDFVKLRYHVNDRLLLIITGKSGKIHYEINDWIKNSKVTRIILHFCFADKLHGGEGAIYIYLRKNIF